MATAQSSASSDDDVESEHVGFDLEGDEDYTAQEKKRLLKIRASQKGYGNLSDYMRGLVDEEIRELDISLE